MAPSDTWPSETTDPLADHRWRSRVVVVFGAGPKDSLVSKQRQIIASMGGAARERNLVLIEFLGATPIAGVMRATLHVAKEGFHAVLVGKDGNPKLSSSRPFAASKLIATIDAMPMRQKEMRR